MSLSHAQYARCLGSMTKYAHLLLELHYYAFDEPFVYRFTCIEIGLDASSILHTYLFNEYPQRRIGH